LTDALTARDVPVQTATYSGIGHMGLIFALARPFRWRAPVLPAITSYLESLGGSSEARCPTKVAPNDQPTLP
jgi:hypothetical protein